MGWATAFGVSLLVGYMTNSAKPGDDDDPDIAGAFTRSIIYPLVALALGWAGAFFL